MHSSLSLGDETKARAVPRAPPPFAIPRERHYCNALTPVPPPSRADRRREDDTARAPGKGNETSRLPTGLAPPAGRRTSHLVERGAVDRARARSRRRSSFPGLTVGTPSMHQKVWSNASCAAPTIADSSSSGIAASSRDVRCMCSRRRRTDGELRKLH